MTSVAKGFEGIYAALSACKDMNDLEKAQLEHAGGDDQLQFPQTQTDYYQLSHLDGKMPYAHKVSEIFTSEYFTNVLVCHVHCSPITDIDASTRTYRFG